MVKVDKKRALPRSERNYPQTYRVFSSLFPKQMEQHDSKCWVPLSDAAKLERMYLRLFKRYQRVKLEFKKGELK